VFMCVFGSSQQGEFVSRESRGMDSSEAILRDNDWTESGVCCGVYAGVCVIV